MSNFKGKLLVFTAPSGAGKTTLVKHLLAKYPEQLTFSVSATTRAKRDNEKEGKDYYFMTPQAFKDCIAQGKFVEWEEVYDNQFYGTLEAEIQRLWSLSKHILFDIDVQGAMNLKKAYGDRCLTVFVLPPSLAVLQERLRQRKSESPESLAYRINKASQEMHYAEHCDLSLLNEDLELARQQAESICETFLSL
jgi:guanylate kinase